MIMVIVVIVMLAATAIAATSCGARSARMNPPPLVQTSRTPNAAIRA